MNVVTTVVIVVLVLLAERARLRPIHPADPWLRTLPI